LSPRYLPRSLARHHITAAIKHTHPSLLTSQSFSSLIHYLQSNLPYTSECFLVSISPTNDITVHSPNERLYLTESWWRTRRRLAVLDLLLSVSRTTKLPETSFIFCPTDCVGANYKAASAGFPAHYGGLDPKDNPPPPNSALNPGASSPFSSSSSSSSSTSSAAIHPPPPIFSQVTCAETNVLPFPIFGARGSHDPRFENYDDFTNLFSASNKTSVDKAIFRGQVEGKTCWSGDPSEATGKAKLSECGRRKLLLIGAYHADAMDFDFASAESSNYIPLQEQSKYSANVVVEGHCGWSDRLRYMLIMDTVAVKQMSFCGEWFEALLEPWVHFVPVSYMLDTLPSALNFVLGNDQNKKKTREKNTEARAEYLENMKKNARAFASDALSVEGIGQYVVEVLRHYNEAFLSEKGRSGEGGEKAEDHIRRSGENFTY
jgi:hypothetical protein